MRGLHRALGAVLLLALPARAVAETIQAADAAEHVGEEVTVEGEVPTVVCSPLACLLSFTTDYSGLVASIAGDVLQAFPPAKETYTARRVRVRGTIVDKNGRPRIEVREPGNLQVVGGGGGSVASAPPAVRIPQPSFDDAAVALPPSDESATPPGSAPGGSPRSQVIDPGRVTSRVGGPREPTRPPSGDSMVAALSGGPGDAAAVEGRVLQQQINKLEEANAALAETVAALEERLTVVEQSGGARSGGVDESALPEIHDYVVPGQSANRLQHVKKGWSSERVLRTLGAPLNTVTEPNGYMTWYYANGRAVTLDPRGRVSSSIGF